MGNNNAEVGSTLYCQDSQVSLTASSFTPSSSADSDGINFNNTIIIINNNNSQQNNHFTYIFGIEKHGTVCHSCTFVADSGDWTKMCPKYPFFIILILILI